MGDKQVRSTLPIRVALGKVAQKLYISCKNPVMREIVVIADISSASPIVQSTRVEVTRSALKELQGLVRLPVNLMVPKTAWDQTVIVKCAVQDSEVTGNKLEIVMKHLLDGPIENPPIQRLILAQT